jgi:hypothetical protein
MLLLYYFRACLRQHRFTCGDTLCVSMCPLNDSVLWNKIIWSLPHVTVLWHIHPVIGNDREASSYTAAVTGKRLRKQACFVLGPLSNSRTATEERCFMYGQCREVISGKVISCPEHLSRDRLLEKSLRGRLLETVQWRRVVGLCEIAASLGDKWRESLEIVGELVNLRALSLWAVAMSSWGWWRFRNPKKGERPPLEAVTRHPVETVTVNTCMCVCKTLICKIKLQVVCIRV